MDCDINPNCEILRIIERLDNFTEFDQIDKKLKKEFLFIQSINSNWVPTLARGHGIRLIQALSQLGKRFRQGRVLRTCHHGDNLEFIDYLNNFQKLKENRNIDEILYFAISNLISISSKCPIYTAAAYSLFIYSTRVADRTGLVSVNELIEFEFQTIAGEKLSALLAYDVDIFGLMEIHWSLLVLQ